MKLCCLETTEQMCIGRRNAKIKEIETSHCSYLLSRLPRNQEICGSFPMVARLNVLDLSDDLKEKGSRHRLQASHAYKSEAEH